MAFNFADAKRLVRQTVHETLGVAGFYKATSVSTPVPIRVRWHSKIDRFGDLESSGYAEVIEGIDRVIFYTVDARAIGVSRTGVISIPELSIDGLVLSSLEPADGPYEEIWNVSRA